MENNSIYNEIETLYLKNNCNNKDFSIEREQLQDEITNSKINLANLNFPEDVKASFEVGYDNNQSTCSDVTKSKDRKDVCGSKYVSSPLAAKKFLAVLDGVLRDHDKTGKQISDKLSGSIIFDISVFKNEPQKLDNLLKLLTVFEDNLFALGLGDQKNLPTNFGKDQTTTTINDVATPIRNYMIDYMNKGFWNNDEKISYLCESNATAFEFFGEKDEEKDNLFLRVNCLKNSNKQSDWKMYLKVYSSIFNYALSNNYDSSYINYLFDNLELMRSARAFTVVDPWKMLDMADTIFTDKEDKLMFIKHFQKDKSLLVTDSENCAYAYSTSHKNSKDFYNKVHLNIKKYERLCGDEGIETEENLEDESYKEIFTKKYFKKYNK